jgi:hypothetical protein
MALNLLGRIPIRKEMKFYLPVLQVNKNIMENGIKMVVWKQLIEFLTVLLKNGKIKNRM